MPEDRPVLDFLLTEGLRHGYHDLAERALRAGASPDARTRDRWPAIVLAAGRRNLPILEALIERDADLNAERTTRKSITALTQAAVRNYPDVARLLLENGVLFGLAEPAQEDVLELARERGNNTVLAVLESPPGRSHANNELTVAIESRRLAEVREWVAESPDLNLPDADLRTPLSVAITGRPMRRMPILRLLLEHGVDVNQADPATGTPPLLQAIAAGPDAPGVARLLLEHGAETEPVDREGNGVSHYLEKVHTSAVRRELSRLLRELPEAANEDDHEN